MAVIEYCRPCPKCRRTLARGPYGYWRHVKTGKIRCPQPEKG